MQNRSHALAREELVRTLAAYSGVTTADGSENKNSLIDSALIGKNDFLTGKSILIMSGAAQYETAGITAFYPAAEGEHVAGEITFTPLSAQIVAGVAFRVLNVLPESLHISSGQVQIQGYDYTSGEYRLVAVNESGQIEIKATVADIVTARVSGVVAVVSGEVHVMSGEVVAKVSGETIVAQISGGPVSILSGEIHVISGEVVAKVSGETLIAKVSGETVIAKVSGETIVAEISGEPVSILSGEIHVISGEVVAKVSGETVIAKVSGETLIAKVSGETVIAKISGEAVKVSGETIIAKISGETVIAKVSGETVIGKVSGETVSIAVPTAIVHFQQTIPDSATQLTAGAVKSAVIKALTANSGMIYLGDSGVLTTDGFELDAGEAASADIDNTNRLYAIASVSGDKICALGVN